MGALQENAPRLVDVSHGELNMLSVPMAYATYIVAGTVVPKHLGVGHEEKARRVHPRYGTTDDGATQAASDRALAIELSALKKRRFTQLKEEGCGYQGKSCHGAEPLQVRAQVDASS